LETETLVILPEEKEAILSDFSTKINEWCELTSRTRKIPPEQMCKIATEVFGDRLSRPWIIRVIDQKFKVSYKSNNAKQKQTITKEQKIEKIKRYTKGLGLNLMDILNDFATPLHQSAVLVTEDTEK
jgi:hypothetical protein